MTTPFKIKDKCDINVTTVSVERVLGLNDIDLELENPRDGTNAPITKLPNFFRELSAAKTAAEQWAAKYKRGYTVYAITEIGTASPSAPPVS